MDMTLFGMLKSKIKKNKGATIGGYLYNSNFYEDQAHTQRLTPEAGKAYYDLGENKFLFYNGSTFEEKVSLVGGKIPSSLLPGSVPDTVEVNTFSDLPATGQSGIIYVVKDENKQQYRWSGTGYIKTGDSDAYYAVTIPNTMDTMGELETYINGINTQGLHVILDMHNFISDAYVCTAHFFVENSVKHCSIMDLLNEQVIKGAFDDDDLISTFCTNKYSIISSGDITYETWTFTLDDNTTVTKEVVLWTSEQ